MRILHDITKAKDTAVTVHEVCMWGADFDATHLGRENFNRLCLACIDAQPKGRRAVINAILSELRDMAAEGDWLDCIRSRPRKVK